MVVPWVVPQKFLKKPSYPTISKGIVGNGGALVQLTYTAFQR